MNRMDCIEACDLLAPFADGELPPDEHAAVAAHLNSCEACSTGLARLQDLRRRIRAAGTFPEPAGLERRIRHALGGEHARDDAGRWRRRAALAASHAAALALGAALVYGAMIPSDRSAAVRRDLVTAHVRALAGSELVQVASSDTHTVRPWYQGRIAFAPPVVDTEAAGFPLLGGRVDYLLDQPAAALVYARRKHRINLFTLPADLAPGAAAAAGTRHGYNVVAWTEGGFASFAVSDLNAAELAEFVAAVRRAPPAAR